MKKSLLILLIILVSLTSCYSEKSTTKITFKTDNSPISITADIADTFEEREVGLMNRPFMDKTAGMLFIMDTEELTYFWMKDTLIPLDMIFLDSNKNIVSIQENTLPCTTAECEIYPSVHPAKYVIEVNAGFVENHKINTNTKVEFNS